MQCKPKKALSGQFMCQMMHLMLEFTLQKRYHRIIPITEDGGENYTAQVIYPIIAEGDAIGTVILTTKDDKVRMGEMEMKLAASAASFLGRQLEQ